MISGAGTSTPAPNTTEKRWLDGAPARPHRDRHAGADPGAGGGADAAHHRRPQLPRHRLRRARGAFRLPADLDGVRRHGAGGPARRAHRDRRRPPCPRSRGEPGARAPGRRAAGRPRPGARLGHARRDPVLLHAGGDLGADPGSAHLDGDGHHASGLPGRGGAKHLARRHRFPTARSTDRGRV